MTRPKQETIFCEFYKNGQNKLMMPKKSSVSHRISTCSIPDLPNTEKDLTESTGVVPAKDPTKIKSEESSNNIREYEL